MLAFIRLYSYSTICYCCILIVAIPLLFNHTQAQNQNGEDLVRERKSVDSVSKELLETQAEEALKVVSAWKKKWDEVVLEERVEPETLRKIISDYVDKLEEVMDLTIVLEDGVEVDVNKRTVEKQEGRYLSTIQELKKQLGFMEKAKDEEVVEKLFLKCIQSTSILLERSIKAIKDMNPGLTGRFFAGFLLDNIVDIGGNSSGSINIGVGGKVKKKPKVVKKKKKKPKLTTLRFYPCSWKPYKDSTGSGSFIRCPKD